MTTNTQVTNLLAYKEAEVLLAIRTELWNQWLNWQPATVFSDAPTDRDMEIADIHSWYLRKVHSKLCAIGYEDKS